MGRISPLVLLLVLAIGIVIGLAVGSIIDFGPKSGARSGPAGTAGGQDPSGMVSSPSRIDPVKRDAAVQEAAAERTASADDPAGLFSAALIRHFLEEIRAAWKASRNEDIPQVDEDAALEECKRNVVAMPGIVGRHRAEERTKEEKAAAAKRDGDASAFLTALREGHDLLSWEDVTAGVLERMVARRGSGRVVSGKAFAKSSDLAEDKLTIEFPPGCYTMDSRRLWSDRSGAFPSDVQISGAGINATLLAISDIGPRSEVKRFSMRDLTIWTNDNGFFDARTASISVDFERVRIIGFDAAHGGAYVFDMPAYGGAIRLRSCEILGGFGRNPGHGDLFRNGPVIAWFEACRFERFNLSLDHLGASSRVLFQGCVFGKMPNPTQQPPQGTRFSSCSVDDEWSRQKMRESSTPRSVTELFPEFQR